MARYVSFRFDDGFIAGARTAAACLAPDHGTFFLVSDLVTKSAASHPEPLFQNRDFGSIAEWRALAGEGQDVQLHGQSHRDLTKLSPDERLQEVRDSLALTRRLHDGPYIFCFPFNRRTTDPDFAALGIAAAGFETRTSDHPVIFHRLDEPIDVYSLKSWAVRERHLDSVMAQIADLPDESWTILAFHSFADEGHEPWSVPAFEALVARSRALGFTIATIAGMITKLRG